MARYYAAKVDANQAEIVDALRKAGATVQPLHRVGSGCPDLLVGYRGANLLMEVKDGSLSPSEQKLRGSQVAWFEAWRGQACRVTSVENALSVLFDAPTQIPLRGIIT